MVIYAICTNWHCGHGFCEGTGSREQELLFIFNFQLSIFNSFNKVQETNYMEELMRADAALAARGLAESREKARGLIEAGLAAVNGAVIAKPAQKVSAADVLTVLGATHPYVGRGGLKLEKALKVFGVDPSGRVCMDIGASTGGFTDVLLRGGAARVYAIDVGAGQLHPSLLNDPRVVSMEHTNARTLTAEQFPEPPTLGVMDVSFISIKLILPAVLKILGDGGRMLTLVKPQFEAGRAAIGKKGVVNSAAAHAEVLKSIVDFVPTLDWHVRALDFSPITGGSGNIEFLADIVPTPAPAISAKEIEQLVKKARKGVEEGETKQR